MNLANEFKRFVLRGTVIDLAIAFMIGAAFGSVVSALVGDLLTPLISAIGANPDFSNLTFTLNHSVFKYGHFINALISFVLLAAVLFFLVVRPINSLIARSRKEPPADPTTRKCPECLSEIPLEARRCRFCASEIKPQ